MNFLESRFPYQEWVLNKQEVSSQNQDITFDFQPISLELITPMIAQPILDN